MQKTHFKFEWDFKVRFWNFSIHTYQLLLDNLEKFKKYLATSRFRVLSGNFTPPRTLEESHEILDERKHFVPSCFYIRTGEVIPQDQVKYNLEWLLENEKEKTFVVCFHPVELSGKLPGTEKSKEKLELLLKNCNFTTFNEYFKEEQSL